VVENDSAHGFGHHWTMNSTENSSNLPLVSVIIPSFNAERFIHRTLDSVTRQTYPNFEVLVVDDGSQDRTAEIVESMCRQDHRIVLLRQARSGVAAARNAAIRQSKGQLIAPIDADDIWHPLNLHKQVQCMLNAGPSVGLVYAWSVILDEQDRLTGDFRASPIEGKVFETLLSHNFLGNASACLMRRDCLDTIGYYSTQFMQQQAQGCEDWDLYLRIAENYQFKVVPEFLIGYRRGEHSMSYNYTAMARSHSLMLDSIWRKNDNISTCIYRLSLVNFYLYLAHDSSRVDRLKISLYCLGQAFRANIIMTLLSYRLYSLVVKNFLKPMANALESRRRSNPHYNSECRWQPGSKPNLQKISDTYRKRIIIKINLLIQNLYHRLVQILFV